MYSSWNRVKQPLLQGQELRIFKQWYRTTSELFQLLTVRRTVFSPFLIYIMTLQFKFEVKDALAESDRFFFFPNSITHRLLSSPPKPLTSRNDFMIHISQRLW